MDTEKPETAHVATLVKIGLGLNHVRRENM
jgi:hypothetical protein